MASVPFHYLDFRTFCYETEDEPLVTSALKTFLPEETDLDRTITEGHHGDRIIVLSARIEGADDQRHVLDVMLNTSDVGAIRSTLPERVDEDCSFFIRFDKQAAVHGEAVLGTGIQVRGKVEAYPAKRTSAIDNLREYFSSSYGRADN